MKPKKENNLFRLLLIVGLSVSGFAVWFFFLSDDQDAERRGTAKTARVEKERPAPSEPARLDEQRGHPPKDPGKAKPRGTEGETALGGKTPPAEPPVIERSFIRGFVEEAGTGTRVAGANLYSATDVDAAFGFDSGIAAIPHAVTDEGGRFSLEVSRPGAHTLVVRHDDYRETVTRNVEPGRDRVVPIGFGYSISGTALDPRGAPAAGGTVLVTGFRGAGLRPLEHRVPVDPRGTFTTAKLHPGDYILTLEEAPGYTDKSLFLGSKKVLLLDRDVEQIVVGSEPGSGAIKGCVLLHRLPVPDADVLIRNTDHLIIDEPDPGYFKEFRPMATTDADGCFQLFGMKPGRYALEFALPDCPSYHRDSFPAYAGTGVVEPQVFAIVGGTIKGRLVDHRTGEPVKEEGSFCFLTTRHTSDESSVRRIPVTKEGTFKARVPAPGHHTILCTAPGYGAAMTRVPLREPGIKNVAIELRPAKTIVVTVKSDVPLDRRFLSFTINCPGASTHNGYRMELPASILSRDSAGRYIIHCNRYEEVWWKRIYISCLYNGIRIAHDTVPVNYSRDEPVACTLTPPRSVRFSGRLLTDQGSAVENATVILHRSGDALTYFPSIRNELPSGRTDATGYFEITAPEPGRWFVWFQDDCGFFIPSRSSRKSKPIDLERGMTERDLQIGGYALAGRLIDADTGEPVSGALLGLQDRKKRKLPRTPKGRKKSRPYIHAEVKERRERWITRTVADRDGRFLFRFLPPSPLELEIAAPGFPCAKLEKVVPQHRSGKKDLCIKLGADGGAFRLIVDCDGPSLDSRLDDAWVKIEDDHFRLDELLREDHGERIFLCRGIPLRGRADRKKVEVEYYDGRKRYTGRAVVTLKEKEIVDIPVVLR